MIEQKVLKGRQMKEGKDKQGLVFDQSDVVFPAKGKWLLLMLIVLMLTVQHNKQAFITSSFLTKVLLRLYSSQSALTRFLECIFAD